MSNTYLFLMDLNMIEFYDALPAMKNAYMTANRASKLDLYQLHMNKHYPKLYAFSERYDDFLYIIKKTNIHPFSYIFLDINVLNT